MAGRVHELNGSPDATLHDKIRRLTLEPVCWNLTQAFSGIAMNNLVTDAYWETARDIIITRFSGFFAGLADETINIERRYPADWWQAFRERWFPAFWLRRWPVQYVEISIHQPRFKAVCPHLRVNQQGPHIEFLMRCSDEQ